MFRIAGLLWDSLPFGWNMSPILAQTCLGELIQGALGTLSGRGSTWEVYHYYDDLLVLGVTVPPVHSLTQCLLHHFTSVGLIISKKSALRPTQDLVWLGKRFDLTTGTICNTAGVLLHVVALAVLAQVVPVHRKLSERVTCYLLWGMRPHLGATLALRAWYLFPWYRCRYLPRATSALRESLGDCVFYACLPWQPMAEFARAIRLPCLLRRCHTGWYCLSGGYLQPDTRDLYLNLSCFRVYPAASGILCR